MVSKAEIIKYFHENHLYVNPELVGHVEKLLASSSLESAFKLALNEDLREYGKSILPADIATVKQDEYSIEGPLILQIQSIKDAGSSKRKQIIHGHPQRILVLQLTDGQTVCKAVEFNKCPSLSLSLAPGTKIQLKNVPVRGGCLLLSSENVSVIGGRVEKLFDTWKLKQDARSRKKAVDKVNPPPPFVPLVLSNKKPVENKSNNKNDKSNQSGNKKSKQKPSNAQKKNTNTNNSTSNSNSQKKSNTKEKYQGKNKNKPNQQVEKKEESNSDKPKNIEISQRNRRNPIVITDADGNTVDIKKTSTNANTNANSRPTQSTRGNKNTPKGKTQQGETSKKDNSSNTPQSNRGNKAPKAKIKKEESSTKDNSSNTPQSNRGNKAPTSSRGGYNKRGRGGNKPNQRGKPNPTK